METECFNCSRATSNIYYVSGIPYCSTCASQKQRALVKRCKSCGVSSDHYPLIETASGHYCVKCKDKEDLKSPFPKQDGFLKKKVDSAISHFYKKDRTDYSHIDKSPAPFVFSGILILILILVLIDKVLNETVLFISLLNIMIFLIAIGVVISFVTIRIKVFDDEIRCLYGPFTYVIKKDEIDQVEITDPKHMIPHGVLVGRINGSLTLKFVRWGATGILIRKKKGIFKSVFISAEDPVKLLQEIAKKL